MKNLILAFTLGVSIFSCGPVRDPATLPTNHQQVKTEAADPVTPKDETLSENAPTAVDNQALVTPSIVLYGNPNCSFCSSAERLLQGKKIPYEFKDLKKDKTLLPMLRDTVGKKRFPYVFVDGKYIGGLAELSTYVNTTLVNASN